ncbi:MAG: glutathione S-transferase [Paracoccaceae bacterium]
MTYHLALGDYAYSSWSLRGWLLFERFGIARKTTFVDFASKDVAAQLAAFAPARTVPCLRTPEGAVVTDSLAMVEELASRHPDAGHLPKDPLVRATARSLMAEIHSSFSALRSECPMGLRVAYDWSTPSDTVSADLDRLQAIWTHARKVCPDEGPWLCGSYSAVDAFYAPVAARIAGFSLPVDDKAQHYVAAHLADPAFRRWRAMGLVSGETLPWYAQTHSQVQWPGPKPRPAAATDRTDSENQACPYSGDAVTHFLELEGRVFGFCNAFCRNKTVADPEAWPAFMALV